MNACFQSMNNLPTDFRIRENVSLSQAEVFNCLEHQLSML